jgi:5'-AMP-activated protein kinase regulatory beta subunit
VTMFTGNGGGDHVEVEGSFDNWTTRQTMQRSGNAFTIIKLLPPGHYQVRGGAYWWLFRQDSSETVYTWLQYKFIVDGEWRYAADQPAMYDDMNNVNNTLEVQEYVPENLDSLEGFEPPPSPPDSLQLLLLSGLSI